MWGTISVISICVAGLIAYRMRNAHEYALAKLKTDEVITVETGKVENEREALRLASNASEGHAPSCSYCDCGFSKKLKEVLSA